MKKIASILGIIIGIWLLCTSMSFAEGRITYQAQYKDAISYDVIIKELEGNEEEYMYRAMICQETDVEASDFASPLGKSFSIEYNAEKDQWEGNTIEALEGIHGYGVFEKPGQYYAYVARVKIGSSQYELINGPTEIPTPPIPALGQRIQMQILYDSTRYSIEVNALNTMLHNGVQRNIQFYLGEITDKELLKNLAANGEQAYDELLQYAKNQDSYLKTGVFQDTKTGIVDSNIIEGSAVETGKYYFLYVILDDEDGTYVEIEDIAAYNGERKANGTVTLVDFDYTEEEESGGGQAEQNPPTNEIEEQQNQQINEVTQNEVVNSVNQNQNTDSTVANKPIPQTGEGKVLIIVGSIILIVIIFYVKYKKYKEVK